MMNQNEGQIAMTPTGSQEGWTIVASEHCTDADATCFVGDLTQTTVAQRVLREHTEQGYCAHDSAAQPAEQCPPMLSPDLQKISLQLYRIYEELAVLQDRILLTRVQSNNEKQKLVACHGFLSESQGDLLSTIDALLSEETTPSSRDRLRSVEGQLQSDNTAFSSQLGVTKSIDSKLGSLEYSLADSQAHFFEVVKNMLSILSPSLASALQSKRDGIDLEPLQATEAPTLVFPQLFEQQSHRIGGVTVVQDRPTDARDDFQDGVRDRDMKMDQDEELLTTDEDLQALHTSRRDALQQKLDAVKHEVVRLRTEAPSAGLHMDPVKSRSLASGEDQSHLPVSQWLDQVSVEEDQSEPTVQLSSGSKLYDQTTTEAHSPDSPWAKTAWEMWMNSTAPQGLP